MLRSLSLVLFLLSFGAPVRAQSSQERPASERTLAVGLALSSEGLALEIEKSVLPRLGIIGVYNWGTETAFFGGARFDLDEEEGLRLYADGLLGMQYCYPVAINDSQTGCPFEKEWRPAGATMLGIEALLGDSIPMTFALEGGVWFVEHPGVHYIISIHFRYWMD